jgi:hypothetical protein
MNNKLTLFGFFISLFLFSNSVLALPCAFFGKVTLDGSSVSGTDVEAFYLNGTFIAKGKEPSGLGSYSIAVNTPGENITLKVKGIAIDQGSQFCGNGDSNYLNISATTPPTTTTIPVTTTVTSQSNGGGGGTIITTIPITTTVLKTEEVQVETSMQGNEEANVETTLPSQVETTTTPSNTIGVTGSFLEIIYSLGYWWILIIIIIVLLVVIILRKYYTIEFK